MSKDKSCTDCWCYKIGGKLFEEDCIDTIANGRFIEKQDYDEIKKL